MKNRVQKQKLDYSYDIIDMRDIPCEALLTSDDPSAVVLSILCDFEDRDKQIVVNTILKRLKELSDDREYKNYLKMVNILSTNRKLENEVEKGVEMLSVDMEKTPFYQLGEKRGLFDGAIVMIEDFQLAIDDVVVKLSIKKEELLEYMQEKKDK